MLHHSEQQAEFHGENSFVHVLPIDKLNQIIAEVSVFQRN